MAELTEMPFFWGGEGADMGRPKEPYVEWGYRSLRDNFGGCPLY